MNKIFTWEGQRYLITEEKELVLLPNGQVLYNNPAHSGIDNFRPVCMIAKYKISHLETGITMTDVAKDIGAILATPVYKN